MKKLIINIGITLIFSIVFFQGSILASEEYELVDEWGGTGSEEGKFLEPMGLAIDKEGNLYVSDPTGNHRIQKFTSDGDFITKWGGPGSGDGEFGSPWGIDVDNEGNVYVADMWNARIQKFTSAGDFITKWSTEVEGIWLYFNPRGLAVDNTGNGNTLAL